MKIKPFAGNPNYIRVDGAIENESALDQAFGLGVDVVVNLAGQTHVDQSLRTPGALISANVISTQKVLDMSRKYDVKRVIQISSAEVYGPVQQGGGVDESAALAPVSPYAASKAASDLLTLSYHQTFGMDTIITRCTNNYGPFQTPEKLVPLAITNAIRCKRVPLYGDGSQMRDWLHVSDHCSAIDAVIHCGAAGSIYNIAGNQAATTREIIQSILRLLGSSWSLVEMVPDRPGNFDRYPLCCNKITEDTGWKPTYLMKDGIQETVTWYRNHTDWWMALGEAAAVR